MHMKPAQKTVQQVGVLLLTALLFGVACGQSPDAKKQTALGRGEKYLKDDKINEAIIEFRTALQVDPNFVPAVQGLGRAYAAKAWNGDAVREFQRAQQLLPNSL